MFVVHLTWWKVKKSGQPYNSPSTRWKKRKNPCSMENKTKRVLPQFGVIIVSLRPDLNENADWKTYLYAVHGKQSDSLGDKTNKHILQREKQTETQAVIITPTPFRAWW